ncbi:MAG: hypothetical protein ACLQMF_09380 [Rectinemataceae bacterium]
MRNFKAAYADALPGVVISRDTVSVPKSPDDLLVLPAFPADFIAWPE